MSLLLSDILIHGQGVRVAGGEGVAWTGTVDGLSVCLAGVKDLFSKFYLARLSISQSFG